MYYPRPTIASRLPAMIAQWQREQPGACWVWPWCKDRAGYGRITVNYQAVPAHRYVYEMVIGPIPDGLTLDHLCRTTSCVNPAHLEPVTQRENTLRGTNWVAIQAAQTQCKRGHPLSGDNVRVRRGGGRVCRTCERDRRRQEINYQGNPRDRDKTHCKHGHAFTPENTYLLKRARRRNGNGIERVCRTCGNAAQKRQHERLKERIRAKS